MAETPRFHLVVHGCRVNQYEAQALREAWEKAGAVAVDDPAAAEVVVALTCGVTARAVQSLRRELPRLRRLAPGARLLCAGCVPQAIPGELKAAAQGWELLGRDDKPGLLHLFDAIPPPAPVEPSASWPPFAVFGSERARALCKIQDGCRQACAFCIIPQARGGPVSRPEAETLAEIERLFASGAHEVVLSGVNLGQYAGESGDLWALLGRIEKQLAPRWAGQARIRLSSLDPALLTDRALEILAASRLLCPHLHLSLQSGSQAVLAAMGRSRYAIADVARWIGEARRIRPVLGLGADLLTGFPGEDESAFAETRAIFDCLPLTYAHVFPFSPRPGTRAAAMAGQVPVSRRLARAQVLRDLAALRAREFAASLLAEPMLFMVVEQQGMDSIAGICEYGVRCRHLLRADEVGRVARRELIPVRPLAVDPDGPGDGLLAAMAVGT